MSAHRKTRARILLYLAGQLEAALQEQEQLSWVFRDDRGEKLSPEEKQAARLEAKKIIRDMDEERKLLLDK